MLVWRKYWIKHLDNFGIFHNQCQSFVHCLVFNMKYRNLQLLLKFYRRPCALSASAWFTTEMQSHTFGYPSPQSAGSIFGTLPILLVRICQSKFGVALISSHRSSRQCVGTSLSNTSAMMPNPQTPPHTRPSRTSDIDSNIHRNWSPADLWQGDTSVKRIRWPCEMLPIDDMNSSGVIHVYQS